MFQAEAVQRILVHAGDKEKPLIESKRHLYDQDKTTKASVLTALIHSHAQLCKTFTITRTGLNNLSVTNQVTSVLQTIFTILRQTGNPQSTGKVSDKVNIFEIHIGEEKRSIEKAAALALVRSVFHAYGLNFENGGGPKSWIGMMNPFINFMSAFNSRMSEVRTGTSRFQVGKSGNQIQEVTVSQYGLSAAHHIHLEGITYTPVKRAAMAQSLGPLTQLIMVHQNRNQSTYVSKWKSAAVRSLKNIEHHSMLIDHIATNDLSTVIPYFALLGDILNIAGFEQLSRRSSPLLSTGNH